MACHRLHILVRFAFISCNRIVSSNIYDKCDGFDFDIFNFLRFDGDVPRASY